MMLELTSREARFLASEVRRRLDDLQNEVVHTERRELKQKVAAETETLERLVRRLEHLVEIEARAE